MDAAKLTVASQFRIEMTPEETMLWSAVRRKQLGVIFRRQQIIRGFIADFYCASHGLVLECDGAHHIVENDAARDALIATYHIQILRFSNDEIRNNLAAVTARIKSTLERP